jgi:hypothetical protein
MAVVPDLYPLSEFILMRFPAGKEAIAASLMHMENDGEPFIVGIHLEPIIFIFTTAFLFPHIIFLPNINP